MKELKALDGLRGLSAFYVLVHHARLLLTQPFKNGLSIHPEKYEWYDKLMVYFFGVFKFGHEAVIIFFVLSGFVIHLRQANSTKNFKLIPYFKKRIIRIYPTLITTFLLCLIVDYCIYLFAEGQSLGIFTNYNWKIFILNFLLIPETGIWGNNYPIWSLEHEWYFYLLYPILLWFAKKNKYYPIMIAVFLYVGFVLGLHIPYFGAVAYTLMVWCLGGILAEIYINNKHLLKKLPYLLLLSGAYPFLSRGTENNPILDLSFGFIMVGFLSLLLIDNKSFLNKILIKFTGLGTFSYSLYLLHFPLLKGFSFLVLKNPAFPPFHLWYVLAGALVVIPPIYIIYYFTERIAINYKQKTY